MNKSSAPSSLNNIKLDEDWSSHPAIEWLSAHKRILLWSLVALFASLIVTTKLLSIKALDAERNFFEAQTAFTQFQQAATTPSTENTTAASDFAQLTSIMQSHPELKAKYDGPLAQTLLIEGQAVQAKPLMDDVFKRTSSDHLKFYQDYSQTSLLIGEGQYTGAIQQAQQLKSNLDQLTESDYPILYVFNLIRLATLYQQTTQSEQELKAWDELQNQPNRLEAVQMASQILQTGQASLDQYIEGRKNALTIQ